MISFDDIIGGGGSNRIDLPVYPSPVYTGGSSQPANAPAPMFYPAPTPGPIGPLDPYYFDAEDPYGGAYEPIHVTTPPPIITTPTTTPAVTTPATGTTVSPAAVTTPATTKTDAAAETPIADQIIEAFKNPYILGGAALVLVLLISGRKNNG